MTIQRAPIFMLQQYLQELDQSRQQLLQCFEQKGAFSSSREGGWSARQIMRHVYLSEFSSAKIFRSAERVCERRDHMSDAELQEERRLLTALFSDRSIKVEAPDRIQPVDVRDDEDLPQELERSREFLLQQLPALSDEQLRTLTFKHPLRGNLSLYGWLWFLACHERRHTAQMSELH